MNSVFFRANTYLLSHLTKWTQKTNPILVVLPHSYTDSWTKNIKYSQIIIQIMQVKDPKLLLKYLIHSFGFGQSPLSSIWLDLDGYLAWVRLWRIQGMQWNKVENFHKWYSECLIRYDYTNPESRSNIGPSLTPFEERPIIGGRKVHTTFLPPVTVERVVHASQSHDTLMPL